MDAMRAEDMGLIRGVQSSSAFLGTHRDVVSIRFMNSGEARKLVFVGWFFWGDWP